MTKNYLLLTTLCIFFSSSVFSQNSAPTVTINNVVTDTANRTITVDFDLADADNDPLEVSAFLSADSGVAHVVGGISVTGDVGFPITPGNNKSLVLTYTKSDLAAAANQSAPWSTIKIVATDRKTPDISDIIAPIDSASVYADMQFLSIPRHHTSAPTGLEVVKDSMVSVFSQSGLQTTRLPFSMGNVQAENIKGRKAGVSQEGKVIIIDGHFDAVSNTPGADDNASAVAAVLAAARVFQQYQFNKSINFLGFDKEEQGLLGAIHYVGNSIESYEDIEAVINGEMLGYRDTTPNSQQIPFGFDMVFPEAVDSINSENRRGLFLFVIGNTQNSSALSSYFDSVARTYVPGVRSLVLNAPGTGALTPDLRRSDHAVFWDAGIPALMLTDGADTRNPHYHQPTDNLSTIDFPFLVKNIKALVATVAALAEPTYAGVAVSQSFQLAQNLDISVAHHHPLAQFEVFPNPSGGQVFVRFPETINETVEITVTAIGGKRILNQKIRVRAGEQINLDLGNNTTGLFFVEVSAGDVRFAKKLILHEGHSH
ncbi:MAG: M28 family peptidase [Cryomorphaceae bacterium]|nr:M28 family peptidase [Cryomorphaceae bacterium]